MNRPELAWAQLHFPSRVEPAQLEALLRALQGLSNPNRTELWAFQLVGTREALTHYLGVPVRLAGAVAQQAASAVSGLRLEPCAAPELPRPRAAYRVWCSTARRPLRRDAPEITSRTLLSGVSGTQEAEAVSLLWLLGPVRRPVLVGSQQPGALSESWPRALLSAPLLAPEALGNEERKALKEKQSVPGWRAVGRIAITAATPERAHVLLRQVTGPLRAAQGPGAALGVQPMPRAWAHGLHRPLRWGLALAVPELVGLLGWPLGDAVAGLPVSRRASRLLPVPRSVPTTGRVLAREPNTGRPIAVAPTESRTHLWIMGPTGVGKSTLLLNLLLQDMQAGRGLVLIEPKGDLVSDVLARVPEQRRDDVVVLSPTDDCPIGLNPLQGGRPELIADQLLTMLAGLHDSWGPRLAELLHAGLVTLARTPDATLAALPALLTNSGFRRRVTARLDDPLGVTPIWQSFDALSEEARAQMTASVLNKIRPLVARPDLRAVLGQARPRFALRDVFTERRILLVDLAKGRVGPDSARLLGTIVLNQLWQQTLARSDVAAEQRHLVPLVVDEFQDFVGLPGDFADVLTQARGLGVSFALAHQHRGQLPEALQTAVLSNARSRVIFQTASQDAHALAKGHPEITPEDFTGLPAYEAYLRLAVDGATTPYMSGVTEPPPPALLEPAELRRASQQRYGQDRTVTDQALSDFITGEGEQQTAPAIGSRRRQS